MNRCVLFLLIIATFPLCAAEIISQKIPDSTVVHAPFALEVIIKTAPNEKIIPADTAGWQKTLLINALYDSRHEYLRGSGDFWRKIGHAENCSENSRRCQCNHGHGESQFR